MRASVWAICVLCGLAAADCGRKGPPLPPIVRLPAAVSAPTIKRLGDAVAFQFTVPQMNTDKSRPADLDRVEVYAHTGALPAPADFVRYGTLLRSIPVRSGGDEGSGSQPGAVASVEQGAQVRIEETITPELMELGRMPAPRRAPLPTAAPAADAGKAAPPPPARYYVAVGVSRGNRRGGFSGPLGVPLVPVPPAPADLRVVNTQRVIALDWTPPFDASGGAALTYNVYQTAGAPATPGDNPPSLRPLNASPLTTPAFLQASVEFDARRCYVVRTVRIVSTISIESQASPSVCFAPADVFPPAAPRALAAVPDERAVSLIWEPNTEPDLAGYRVLRGEATDDKLSPLTSELVKETTYRDTTVTPGISYVYAVVAVDSAATPNTSAYSDRVTAVAR